MTEQDIMAKIEYLIRSIKEYSIEQKQQALAAARERQAAPSESPFEPLIWADIGDYIEELLYREAQTHHEDVH